MFRRWIYREKDAEGEGTGGQLDPRLQGRLPDDVVLEGDDPSRTPLGDDTPRLEFTDHKGITHKLTTTEAAKELERLTRLEEKAAGADEKFRQAAADRKAAEEAKTDAEQALQLRQDLHDFKTDEAAFKRLAPNLGLPEGLLDELWPIVSGKVSLEDAVSDKPPAAGPPAAGPDNGPLPMHIMPTELQELVKTLKDLNLGSGDAARIIGASRQLVTEHGEAGAQKEILTVLDKSPKLGTILRRNPQARTAIVIDAVQDAEARIRAGERWGPELIQRVVQRVEGLADALGLTTGTSPSAGQPSLADLISGVGPGPGAAAPSGVTPDAPPIMDPRDIDAKGAIAKFADARLAFDSQQADEQD